MLSDKSGVKTQLAPTSTEFNSLEYALQLSLSSTTSRLLAAYAISNPTTTLQFEKTSKDSLTLFCWVDASELNGANTEEDVIKRGFRLTPPQQGLKFVNGPIGHHKMDGKVRKALYCQVAVGRAYVADEASAERDSLPDGYDSFYIKDPQVIGEDESYVHEYFIKNMAQVLPMYIIHYEYDSNQEVKSREVV